LRDLVGIEARQQLPIALGNGGDSLVDEPPALVGELDDHASSVIRVWEATDETSPLESIDPRTYRPRDPHVLPPWDKGAYLDPEANAS